MIYLDSINYLTVPQANFAWVFVRYWNGANSNNIYEQLYKKYT